MLFRGAFYAIKKEGDGKGKGKNHHCHLGGAKVLESSNMS